MCEHGRVALALAQKITKSMNYKINHPSYHSTSWVLANLQNSQHSLTQRVVQVKLA